MRATNIIRQVLHSLRRNWLQSVLSVLGIGVGVAAFICVVAIGNASTSAVEDQMKNLGDNFIWIEAGSRNVNGRRMGARGTRSLVLEDAYAIMEQVPLIRRISPNVDGPIQVVYGNQNWMTFYRGVGPEFINVRRWRLQSGGFFDQHEVDSAAPVCVLGHTVAEYLFEGENPLGKTVRVRSMPCRVVGVLQKKGFASNGRDQDDFLVMPFTTVQKRITGTFWLEDVFCSAVSQGAMPAARRQIIALLRERHHLNPGEDNDFNIRSPEDAIHAQLATARIMTILMASIASLSLLVGGIGIMNIMLVAVTQRTREIGVRMAVGATEWDVQVQFLGEAVLISAFGAGLGMLLGIFASGGVEQLFHFPTLLSTNTFIISAGFAALIGVLFGYYPARRASQLDPIASLRWE